MFYFSIIQEGINCQLSAFSHTNSTTSPLHYSTINYFELTALPITCLHQNSLVFSFTEGVEFLYERQGSKYNIRRQFQDAWITGDCLEADRRQMERKMYECSI
jgi:hypothetical protein